MEGNDKASTINSFHQNLPLTVKSCMTLENDDKTYKAKETLAACEKEAIPFVFDYHHHMANLCEKNMEELLPAFFRTWEHKEMLPKIHISSPKTVRVAAFRLL